jgi:hypothetical protein
MVQTTFRSNRSRRIQEVVRNVCVVIAMGMFSAFACFVTVSRAQTASKITLQDNSDSWSDSRPTHANHTAETQDRAPSDGTYRISGIDLTDDVLEDAASKLGKVKLVERAAGTDYARTQACYVSADGSPRVFLVFEMAAFPGGPGFYLFSDGTTWKGMEFCLKSALVSPGLATASGLHFGQTPADIKALLGKPSFQAKDELIYVFHAHQERSAAELKKQRESNPQLSNEEFHDKFAVYDLEVSIHVRFVSSKLTYLRVSKAEIN